MEDLKLPSVSTKPLAQRSPQRFTAGCLLGLCDDIFDLARVQDQELIDDVA